MAHADKKAISRIRTFNADVSHARGEEVPAGPKLKKEKKSVQAKANAILNTPKANLVPKKAQQMKRKKSRHANEFLSANADIPPIEAPSKKEHRTELKKDLGKNIFVGMDEVHKPKPLPKEIKVRTSMEQNVKVADNTLDQEVRKIQERQSTTTTFEDTPQQVSLTSDEHEGVIIQNKKQKSFRLLPAIGASIKDWAKQKQITLQQAKEPKHVVREADTRLDTITKAARNSFHAPQSDHGIVVKRLAQKNRVKKEAVLSIRKKEDIDAPTWTYTDNTAHTPTLEPVATPTLEPELRPTKVPIPEPSQTPQKVDMQLKKRVVSNTTKPDIQRVTSFPEATVGQSTPRIQIRTHTTPLVEAAPVASIPEHTPVPVSIPKPTALSTEPKPNRQTQSVSTHVDTFTLESIPTPVSPTPTPAPVTTRAPKLEPPQQDVPIPTPEEAVVPQKTRAYVPSPVDRPSRIPIYVYMLVIVGASLLGIGTSVYWFMSATPTHEAVAITIPSLIQTNQQIPVPLSQTREETYNAILNASLESRETIQIYPTLKNDDGTTVPADAATIMQYVGYRAPGSFTRSIKEITFGNVDGTDPFILMRVGNFDTAFAGMLAWEPVLSTDLSPLFGSPVSASYDPYARTDSQIRAAFFRDTIISNKSARILVDAKNTQRIIYSFVKPNLILITTTEKTFNQLLPLLAR